MAKVDIDEGGLYALTHAADGPVQRDLDERAARVLAYQVANCPVETGRLRSDLHIESQPAADGSPARQIGTGVAYALYVEMGTGLYGPRHKRITPKRPGGLLVWEDAGGKHFARSTRGMRPQPFIRPSLQAGR